MIISQRQRIRPDGDTLVIDAAALPDGTIIPVGIPTDIPQGTLTVLADGTVTLEPARDVFGWTRHLWLYD